MKTFARFVGLLLLISMNIGAGAETLPNFKDLVGANSPAVVNISTTQVIKRRVPPHQFDIPDLPEDSPFRDFFRRFFEDMPEERDSRSLGSGFVISRDGYILTSAHVIADAKEITVRLSDRRELEAKVVGADRRSDVALLKVEATDLPMVKIGDPEKLSVGEWVLAIGSPFGFESTATAGIVSAKGRALPNENYVPFIQTDVAINPGNSGGPLFNLDGEVVGVNAQIYSRTGGFMGLSFAVPIDIAVQVAEQLKAHGKVSRGWLGVLIQNVTRELAESFGMEKPMGALVSEIMPDSPAAKSALKPGDVIVSFDGKSLEKMSDLPPLVGVTPVGKTVDLEVVRDGKTEIVEVLIGELPGEDTAEAGAGKPEGDDRRLLGMTVKQLDAEQRKTLEVDGGVLVEEVTQGPASRAGIQEGDVILQIQGKPVNDVETFEKLVGELPEDKSVPVLIKREKRSLFLALRSDDAQSKDQ
ncbi:MAG: DegQ family serine endoprotease [Gammaproteobacteria bacterium]|nr:DegQ family serine endoprotease [Gammaproteobacteria bacterium]